MVNQNSAYFNKKGISFQMLAKVGHFLLTGLNKGKYFTSSDRLPHQVI
jgi:hypothetical protein